MLKMKNWKYNEVEDKEEYVEEDSLFLMMIYDSYVCLNFNIIVF